MNRDYYKWRKYIGKTLIVVLCVIIFFEIFPMGRSPKSIVKRFYKARNWGNTKLLKKIMYFEPGTTEEQKQAKAESILACRDEKLMMRIAGIGIKVKYQKYIDDSTAEVGTVASGVLFIGKHYPGNQIILRKENGVWKYSHIMGELPIEVLTERLKNNPENTDLYFHLAKAYLSENLARSHRYYLKCYELDPDGFWVDEDFGERIKEYKKEFEQTEVYEKEMLAMIEDMGDRSFKKAIRYQRLGQLFMEKKDYQKASFYLDESEAMFKLDPSPSGIANLKKAKAELHLRVTGQYTDILTELEQK